MHKNPTIIERIKFDDRGLIPAVVQHARTTAVLGLDYLDSSQLVEALTTGVASLDVGEGGSGESNVQKRRLFRIVDVRITSEGECLTMLVEPEDSQLESHPSAAVPPAISAPEVDIVDVGSMDFGIAVNRLYALIADRKEKRPEGSYTSYLFNQGLDKILKKVAEESGEVIIAAKNRSLPEIVSELSDLFYHLLVLMVERDVKLADVQAELARRASPSFREDPPSPASRSHG